MKITAEPRSDQWNADDFTGGARTFTISGVKDGAAEQKYDIALEGEARAWRPPLTMLRVLLKAWGDESDEWVGRRVTLYQDPTVRFGKDVLGGIRISHLSHIGDKPLNVKVTTTRGKRETVTVQPLKESPAPKQQAARDFLAEAEQANGDPDLLRALWKAAKAAGEPATHLDTIQAMATPTATTKEESN
ncbi:hypothetical protein ArV2_gp53 [Arthrobacter phage vB_ArS-ArV2]|uniref:Uncharacterized protein n=1 Tax=Arthrobacter phage vB_ArS-ArV2 TaxID=1414742 RepID=V5RBF5_9CAUD|nr:hypothetical protein ArV2_gp53 [Arthrobacter phage vB_ArS-ArV2]AHB31664.1 hypothetical protein ArV2_gp53 [Arthrobacter phage vB_ArS-ArV2]